MFQTPSHIIRTLFGATYGDRDALPSVTITAIAEEIKKLSEWYNSDPRGSLAITPMMAKSYAIYYGSVNFEKIMHLLTLLPKNFIPKSVLDFGSGPATATLAAIERYGKDLTATLIEESSAMRSVASTLLEPLLSRPATIHSSLQTDHQKFDLIITANCLNEILSPKKEQIFFDLCNRLAPNGVLIILEPGTQTHSCSLVALRELFINQKDTAGLDSVKILYPCTHENSCKLFREDNGWCHRDLRSSPSVPRQQLDEALGFNKHTISFSALILQNAIHPQDTPSSLQPNAYRVITEAKKTKICTTAYLCGAAHQGTVTLQKRHKNEANRHLDKVKMHDLIEWDLS